MNSVPYLTLAEKAQLLVTSKLFGLHLKLYSRKKTINFFLILQFINKFIFKKKIL